MVGLALQLMGRWRWIKSSIGFNLPYLFVLMGWPGSEFKVRLALDSWKLALSVIKSYGRFPQVKNSWLGVIIIWFLGGRKNGDRLLTGQGNIPVHLVIPRIDNPHGWAIRPVVLQPNERQLHPCGILSTVLVDNFPRHAGAEGWGDYRLLECSLHDCAGQGMELRVHDVLSFIEFWKISSYLLQHHIT